MMTDVHLNSGQFMAICALIAIEAVAVMFVVQVWANRILKAIEQLKKDHQ